MFRLYRVRFVDLWDLGNTQILQRARQLGVLQRRDCLWCLILKMINIYIKVDTSWETCRRTKTTLYHVNAIKWVYLCAHHLYKALLFDRLTLQRRERDFLCRSQIHTHLIWLLTKSRETNQILVGRDWMYQNNGYFMSGVHFSLNVLPSWADRGWSAHKCLW